MRDEVADEQLGFWFMRHGETWANAHQVACGGDCDESMIDSGREQVRQAATFLSSKGFVPNLIITSPTERNRESAEIVRRELCLKAEIHLEVGLTERMLGEWNYQHHHVVNELILSEAKPKGGESRAQFGERVMICFNNLRDRLFDWPLIIGSRGTARVILEQNHEGTATSFPNGKLMKVSLSQSKRFEVATIERFDSD